MKKENKYHKGLAVASWTYFIILELVLFINRGMETINWEQFFVINFPLGGVMLVLAIYYSFNI